MIRGREEPAPEPQQEPAEQEPAPEEEPAPPPPVAAPARPPERAAEAQPARRFLRKPAGCRCTKLAFRLRGCDGVECRRKWASYIGDNTPSLGPRLNWRKLAENYVKLSELKSFWGGLGNRLNDIKRIGTAINHGYDRRRAR